ncbi:Phosphoribosylglycinamide formyltransferase [Burkholderia glumae]|nr:phosphoribosylglycinamide formyltransferase [Burkholderia glumae LMG 2196 = ATCC 33617]QKM48159.1 Phosphoribosylglycinamide formyltransferase [Burkholderia glumae]QKM52315.1 Phosphoribosylglycinamide formyltransferase [Burkholderia glumae]QTP33879.1 Phosphoribosylglycinamide formyltransferase [Burkholderia glumae]
MEAIVDACERERWPASVAAVIANRPDAAGLSFAAARGIPAVVVDHRDHDGREAFDAALAAEIDRFAPDLVVLAGFMRILTPAFVTRYEGRMLNVHPSLLPSFKGMRTHEAALAAGVALHGATVHFVIPELDSGAIVAQAAVPVHDGDTAQTLAARVLVAEHQLYPRAVRWFVEGRLRLDGGRAVVAPGACRWLVAADNNEQGEGV